jgi:hypothetical protein
MMLFNARKLIFPLLTFDNVPRVKLGITIQEIVEIIQECRTGI